MFITTYMFISVNDTLVDYIILIKRSKSKSAVCLSCCTDIVVLSFQIIDYVILEPICPGNLSFILFIFPINKKLVLIGYSQYKNI